MREILPGVHHWTSTHPRIHIEVSSYFLSDERVLIDPLVPEEGLEWFGEGVEHIMLTNRHHYRGSGAFVKAFGCTVWCSEPGMHEFTHGEKVRPFAFGETLPGGIEAFEIGAICPDETALVIPKGKGIVALADGVMRDGDGPLGFVDDDLIGDDPEAVKEALKRAYRRLLRERRFDTLLLAHGWPIAGTGRKSLETFVQE